MDYLYITIAVVGFALQFSLVKLYQSRVVDSSMKMALIAEKSFFLSMALSAVTGLIFLFVKGFSLDVTRFSTLNALGMAVISTICAFVGIIVLSRGKMSIYTLFMMLGGMMIPFLAGVAFWDEPLTLPRVIGLAMLTVSLYFPVLEKSGGKSTKLFFFLCLCIFLANGMHGVIGKHQQSTPGQVDTGSFIAMRELIIVAMNAVLWLFLYVRRRSRSIAAIRIEPRFVAINALIIVAFAVVYGTAQYFHLLAASTLDASLQFPIVTGGTMVLAAAAGFIFFRERPGKFASIGIAIALIATILFGLGERL